MEKTSILIIGSAVTTVEAVTACLRRRGHKTQVARSGQEGSQIHRDEGATVVLVVLPLSDLKSTELLAKLRAEDPRVSVIVTGLDDDILGAPEALALGANEYLSDPIRDESELLYLVGLTIGLRKGDVQLRYLRKKDAAGTDWQTAIGESESMRRVFASVRHICHRTSSGGTPTILLTGETGTGKGLIAKSIHYSSVRRSNAFVELNCASIPSTLVEAELFGYERGAFTDAKTSRAGLFQTANGGTLFLDEISSMPIELQGKLLTAIEEKRIRRIGARKEIRVDVQVIAATNRPLGPMRSRGEFREDLYHRLNVVALNLPPLRERKGDILKLAESFLASICKEYGIPTRKLSKDAREAMEQYQWPGNVRELRNQIERIVLLEPDETITARQLHFGSTPTLVKIEAVDDGEIEVELPDHGFSLEALEREVLRKSLDKCTGNVAATARYLDISRRTLVYRMEKHGFKS